MSIPTCEECLRKHLADAVSLGKEVMNGHSAGGNPDHRVDFSGEMIEAEKHALLLDKTLGLKIRALRRTLQTQRWRPLESDVEKIKCFWYVSYVVGGKQILEQLETEDAEVADIIKRKLAEYAELPYMDEQSDVVKHCKCDGDKNAKINNNVFGSPTAVLIASNKEKIEGQIANVKANIIGIDRVIKVPSSFEKWPKTFIELNEKLFSEKLANHSICMWPDNAEILKRTNIFAFPSIIEGGELSKSDITFCESEFSKRPVKFYKIPVYVSAEMLVKLCEEYEKITGKTEIDDLYSIIRTFDKSPVFDNKNHIIVKNGEEITEKTLFRLNID